MAGINNAICDRVTLRPEGFILSFWALRCQQWIYLSRKALQALQLAPLDRRHYRKLMSSNRRGNPIPPRYLSQISSFGKKLSPLFLTHSVSAMDRLMQSDLLMTAFLSHRRGSARYTPTR